MSNSKLEAQLTEAASKITRHFATRCTIADAFRPVLEKQDSAYDTLAATNVRQAEALAEHERLARQFVDHVNGLKKQIADLMLGNEGYAGAVTEYQDGADRLQTTITKQAAKLTVLTNANEKWSKHHDLERNRETIDELKRQLATSKTKWKATSDRQDKLLTELLARATKAEQKVTAREADVDRQASEIESLNKCIHAMEERAIKAEGYVTGNETLDSTRDDLVDANVEIDNLQIQVLDDGATIAAVEEKLVRAKDELAARDSEIGSLDESFEVMEQRMNDAEESLAERDDTVISLQEDLTESEALVASLQTTVDNLEEDLAQARQEATA